MDLLIFARCCLGITKVSKLGAECLCKIRCNAGNAEPGARRAPKSPAPGSPRAGAPAAGTPPPRGGCCRSAPAWSTSLFVAICFSPTYSLGIAILPTCSADVLRKAQNLETSKDNLVELGKKSLRSKYSLAKIGFGTAEKRPRKGLKETDISRKPQK